MKKIIILLIIFCININALFVIARTPAEIQKEIDQKNQELQNLNKQLEQAQKELNSANTAKSGSQSEINKVINMIKATESELNLVKIKKQEIDQQIILKDLEKAQRKSEQEEQMISSYIQWKTTDISTSMLLSDNQDMLKTMVYMDIVNKESEEELLKVYLSIEELEKLNEQYKKDLEALAKKNIDLQKQKIFLENQVNSYNEAIKRANSNADGLRSRTKETQTQIEGLSEEWDAAQKNFEDVVNSGSNGGNQTLITGEFYVSGTSIWGTVSGKYHLLGDSFGHGIGLSQWGAYGAANRGWSAERILRHYYSNTEIQVRPGINISVQGHGTMTADNYVAGLGEVPSRACGNLEQIQAWEDQANQKGWASNDPRRAKYVIDNTSTTWDCWPEEAIKAQVIAARSYGVTNSQPICTTAACQVYTGGNAKAWAAYETSNMYVVSKGSTHNNQIIRAFYSSYNHNGWGTADNDTIWSGRDGNGTFHSYLRAVYDADVTFHSGFNKKDWRTNSYSLTDLNNMLIWCGNNCASSAWIKTNVIKKIGTLQSITTEKDASGRVKKVVLNGTNGQARIAGWYFRDIFNLWIKRVRPSGQEDYMQSLTFVIKNVE